MKGENKLVLLQMEDADGKKTSLETTEKCEYIYIYIYIVI